MPDGSYAGCAMGLVIQSGDKAFYFAGYTTLHQDMKQISTFYDIDFAYFTHRRPLHYGH
jgi:hypothetical protein